MGNNTNNFLDRAEKLTLDALSRRISFEEWSKEILGYELYSEENLRRCAVFLDSFLKKIEDKQIENCDSDILEKIEEERKRLEIERKKIQTVNIEYNANLRKQARLELFNDMIKETIERLPPIEFKDFRADNEKTSVGVLAFGDVHYGLEFNIDNNVDFSVNAYSPEIAKDRFQQILESVVEDYDLMQYGELNIFDMGDAIQNYLRLSDIAKVRTGVIQSTLEYAEMIAQWLNELSNRLEIPIRYWHLGGNHSQLRLLEQGKNFEEENLGRVIREFIALRLKDNKMIAVLPYDECAVVEIEDYTICAVHGENCKNIADELHFWEEYNDVKIDLLIMGHFHHASQNTVGIGNYFDKEVMTCPSIVGIDEYSKRIRRLARPGAKFFTVNPECGKEWEKTIYVD